MKKILVPVLSAAVALVSCSKESTSSGSTSISCSGVTATYAANVLPVVQSYCATGSNCHASGSSEGPGALTTYQQIYNNRSAIRSSVVSGSMPRGTSLTTAQKSAIVCWIDNGAANN